MQTIETWMCFKMVASCPYLEFGFFYFNTLKREYITCRLLNIHACGQRQRENLFYKSCN